jgi:hypothetical protein
MHRLSEPPVARCEHGYERIAARRDCPRCAERPSAAPRIEPRFPHTRWHATDTTLGPRWKVAITFVIVVVFLFMVYELHFASDDPLFTLWVVPLTAFTVFAVRVLPEVWTPGRLPVSQSDDR